MQFQEGASKQGKCPVCGKPVPVRTTRGPAQFCSRVCASQPNYSRRYKGTLSGPADRPTLQEKLKYDNS